jgi:hypothetical protein
MWMNPEASMDRCIFKKSDVPMIRYAAISAGLARKHMEYLFAEPDLLQEHGQIQYDDAGGSRCKTSGALVSLTGIMP